MPKTKRKNWGFDTTSLNKKARPQDDFFEYANGGWLRKNPIPEDESVWGTFYEIRVRTEKQIKILLDEVRRKKSPVQGSEEQLIRDFYLSGLDIKRRNALKAKPLDIYRTKIDRLDSYDDLVALFAEYSKIGVVTPWDIDVDQDLKNTTKNALYLGQDGLGMPDRDYYLKNDAESLRVRRAYEKHIHTLLALAGYSKKESTRRLKIIMRLETYMAEHSMKRVEMRNPYNIYHKKTLVELRTLAPRINWALYFKKIDAPLLKNLIVMQPKFIQKINSVFVKTPLEDWKVYLEWHLINSFASYLSQEYIDAMFNFYGRVLTGDKKIKPLWRRVAKTVEGSVGEALGKLYIKKYFGKEAKEEMNKLIDNLFEAYEVRLKNLDWMADATKKKALIKLRSMNRKIGYPDKWKSYKGLKIVKDNYLKNVIASHVFEHKRMMKKLGKPIDRHEWFTFPQTVNAFYSPLKNEIVFPAGILQAPFFDVNADAAVNYGAIGSVIGHEITHGFDDEGSKFDAKGNLKNWWTPGDRKRFETKARVLEKQFDSFSVAPGIPVNGKLTLGENIADLGGAAIGYDALQIYLDKEGREDIEGFTPEQRYFFGLAQFERAHSRKERLKTMVKVDPHSPAKFRINGPFSNMEEFYKAFNVTKKDKLYRSPSKRAKIW